jgi:hypothetical protein
MWSSVTIPGVPRILMLDLTQNANGWEYAFFDRLHLALEKSGLQVEEGPLRPNQSIEFQKFQFNCLLVFAHERSNILEKLHIEQPYLLALCSVETFDPELSDQILKQVPSIAPMSTMSAREAGLFYLKFFTELNLHSKDHISGKMVWFSFSKAKEFLKRRRYSAKFGVKC